ncbi:MAG: hypothetical protein DWQ08_05060 [Proteobacteria bacterium]|nr:MAG: hypothetical protein DWQ08_05060 [Pseudomonadota bacterium]
MRYAKFAEGNFGDDLNPWLWPKLVPGVFDETERTCFMGIGSGLTRLFARSCDRTAVMGTGAANYNIRFTLGADFPWKAEYKRQILDWPARAVGSWIPEGSKIYCVRGPLTARLLGLSEKLAHTDPAILIRQYIDTSKASRTKISFMPHHLTAASANLEGICRLAGFDFIDPRSTVDAVVEKILDSKVLLSEALHGAIVADALRVPWIPIVMSKQISQFKWKDYCASLGMPYQPVSIAPEWSVDGLSGLVGRRIPRRYRPLLGARATIANRRRKEETLMELVAASGREPTLSTDAALSTAESRLLESVEKFKTDVAAGFWS